MPASYTYGLSVFEHLSDVHVILSVNFGTQTPFDRRAGTIHNAQLLVGSSDETSSDDVPPQLPEWNQTELPTALTGVPRGMSRGTLTQFARLLCQGRVHDQPIYQRQAVLSPVLRTIQSIRHDLRNHQSQFSPPEEIDFVYAGRIITVNSHAVPFTRDLCVQCSFRANPQEAHRLAYSATNTRLLHHDETLQRLIVRLDGVSRPLELDVLERLEAAKLEVRAEQRHVIRWIHNVWVTYLRHLHTHGARQMTRTEDQSGVNPVESTHSSQHNIPPLQSQSRAAPRPSEIQAQIVGRRVASCRGTGITILTVRGAQRLNLDQFFTRARPGPRLVSFLMSLRERRCTRLIIKFRPDGTPHVLLCR